MKRQIFLPVTLSIAMVTIAWAGGFFKVGETAPTFSLTSVTGKTVSLQDLQGKVVVLGLFHICEPCLIQSTNLQKVYDATRGQNVAVIGVNSSGDSQADVLEFLSVFPVKVTYPYLTDPDQITDKLYGGGRFIPNVYILDQNGVIRWQRVGNMDLANHTAILDEVNKLLGTSSGSTNEEIIGEWKDNVGVFWKRNVKIMKQRGKFFVVSTFHGKDGSTSQVQKQLAEMKAQLNETRRFKELNNAFGEMCVINADGNLDLYDKDGFIREAKKILQDNVKPKRDMNNHGFNRVTL